MLRVSRLPCLSVCLLLIAACSDAPSIVAPIELADTVATPVDSSPISPDLTRFGGSSAFVAHALPLDIDLVDSIVPLGSFTSGDGLPSPDALFVVGESEVAPVPVRAVADGLVTAMDRTNGVLVLRVRDAVEVRYSGLMVSDALRIGDVVASGEQVGEYRRALSPRGLALRVYDQAVDRSGWTTPERYGALANVHFIARYFEQPLRSSVYGRVRRASPDLDGRIDYDRAGALAGTWFDVAAASGAAPSVAQHVGANAANRLDVVGDPRQQLAPIAITLAYDVHRPGQVRIAIGHELGARLGLHGVFAVAWEDRDPATVNVSDGSLRYSLYDVDDTSRIGTPLAHLDVEMADGNALRLQVRRPGGAVVSPWVSLGR